MTEPGGARGTGLRLEQLGPRHARAILAGQDDALAEESFGVRWERDALASFLERTARWRPDGPLREYAAVGPTMIGGGGLHLLGPGLQRGQADLSYWVLAGSRGAGWGAAIARALVHAAADDPALHELVLRIAPQNLASQRVAAGLGAHRTGERERHPADGRRTVERWVLVLRGAPGPTAPDA